MANLSAEDSPWTDDVFEDVFSDMRVHRTQGIVQQVRVCLSIHSASKTDALLLSARQVDALKQVSTFTQ